MTSPKDRLIQSADRAVQLSRRDFLSAACLIPFLGCGFESAANARAVQSIPYPELTPEDGYEAWLRYRPVVDPVRLDKCRKAISSIYCDNFGSEPLARDELVIGLSTMLGQAIPVVHEARAGAVILAQAGSYLLKGHFSFDDVLKMGSDGFMIKTVKQGEGKAVIIASYSHTGILYGAFTFLRLLQNYDFDLHPELVFDIEETPKNPLRILAHWDNLDGTVERGYAGRSLWKWSQLPDHVDGRLKDYARLNASLGINGVVLNNVNADPMILDSENLCKVASLAGLFHSYGINTYLCINFASPSKLGHLPTSDPLDGQVIDWWHKKVEEIYKIIPWFGGFLVKANSEDLPGPQDYGRTHADGANMLAAALNPHGGIVIWRAFVYTAGNQDPDRVKRAYLEFKPLDGKFAKNVLVQVKTGPLDFQPREPFHPLFGAMPKTRETAELQITQEYLGQSTHLVYLAPMWKEVLDSNTYGNGANSSVAQIIESFPKEHQGGFVGGANVGRDQNWCGHHFAQANWYAFGRLAWNPTLSPGSIAREWIELTWSKRPENVKRILDIMMVSHEAYVNYTMPLGLHHMVGGNHYAPLPEGEGDPRGIFHHAALDGIGYDRTRETGSGAVNQYHSPLNDIFNDPAKCPEKYLLWFHHLPWNHRMESGRTLWQELCNKYATGVRSANTMLELWLSLEGEIDVRRFEEVATKLKEQKIDARNWSIKCLTYFEQYSKMKCTEKLDF